VVVADIAVDPLWAEYRHLPLAHGLRACWSVILSSAGQVLGTFAVLSPRSPRPQDLEVLEQIAAVAAVAIQHQRAQSAPAR
jgi:GAF domain-containing protein